MKRKEPTWTSLVLELLEARDDFLTYEAIRAATGGSRDQISAACIHLRRRRAIDCIVEPDGVAWWFATPETDNRSTHVDFRAPEAKPRKRRRTAKPLPKANDAET